MAAARRGLEVVLVEQRDHVGGIAATGICSSICGLFGNASAAPHCALNQGLPQEVYEALKELDGTSVPKRMGRAFVLPFRTDALGEVLTRLLSSERSLTLLLGSKAHSVSVDNGVIGRVAVSSAESDHVFVPSAVIDCSGNGSVIEASGAAYELAPVLERQMAGSMMKIGGLGTVDDFTAVRVPFVLSKGVSRGLLPDNARFTSFEAGRSAGEGYCKLCVYPATHPKHEADVKGLAETILRCLSEALPPFRYAFILEVSKSSEERERIRMKGKSALTERHVLDCVKVGGGAPRNSWPIEFWDQHSGPKLKYLPEGEHYEIPPGCFESQTLSNLYCAGRCISASPQALASARTIGPCLATGEYVGSHLQI